jgi:glycosyltransferase involved in cell wall biosynthesis
MSDTPLGAGHILFVGAQGTSAGLRTRRGVSPATLAWQDGLIGAVRAEGWQVTKLGHMPEPVWPRGEMFVDEEPGDPGSPCALVPYTNFPGWRQLSLARAYLKALPEIVEVRGAPTHVVTWNWLPGMGFLAEEVRRRYGIPWVCIAADLPDDWMSWKTIVERRADGILYLPWERYVQSPASNKIHLDGGVDGLHFGAGHRAPERDGPRTMVYAGTMALYGGLGLLLESLPHIRTRDCRIVVCGKGDTSAVDEVARRDERVVAAGFMEEDELHALLAQAWGFVNPRLAGNRVNRGNFPSKILTYLAYGRPVVSTWTEGLSPDYRRVLVAVTEDTPAALAVAIDSVLQWDEEQCDAMAGEINEFMTGSRLWSLQARRFLNWLGDGAGPSSLAVDGPAEATRKGRQDGDGC